jgi:hypothetical protein
MKRYEVRIQEIDGSSDIIPVWAPSEEDAINLAVTWIDYVERRPMYSQPASAKVIGSVKEEGDLSDTTTSPFDVAHRRTSRDGRELGTSRRPVEDRIRETTESMRSSEEWEELRKAIRAAGLNPQDCVVVSEILDAAGGPASGALIARDRRVFGFVRDRDGQLSIGGGDELPESTAGAFAPSVKVALEILNDTDRE